MKQYLTTFFEFFHFLLVQNFRLFSSFFQRFQKKSNIFVTEQVWTSLEQYNFCSLGTIKKKLDFNKYANAAHFVKDLELVWKNCLEYNDEGRLYFFFFWKIKNHFIINRYSG